MSSVTAGLISAGCIFGGVLLGLSLQRLLPIHHLRDESKETIKLGAGMIATLSALVLGLLVGSAKGTFDTMNSEITQSSATLILLDRALARYGPETGAARQLLRSSVAATIARLWPEAGTHSSALPAIETANGIERLQDKLRELTPVTEAQRAQLAEAKKLSGELLQARWLIIEQEQGGLSPPFLVVLLFWLTLLFVSFGLFAPHNVTVITVLFLCALSLAGAIFLISEMSHPLEGLVKVSSAPLRKALHHLGQ